MGQGMNLGDNSQNYYKYETHLHTSQGSACSGTSAECQVRALKALGYQGAFITDHFFNGNTAVDRRLPWDIKVHLFCQGYEEAKRVGDEIGFQVFFGFEFCYHASEFLVYGVDKEFLLNHPEIVGLTPWELCELVHSAGGFLVQAHPFREASYIKDIKLYPDFVDGVEVINTSHRNPKYNERALWYAESYRLPKTGGSDTHYAQWQSGGGIAVEKPFETPDDYYQALIGNKLTVLEKCDIDANSIEIGELYHKGPDISLLPQDLKAKAEEFYKNEE